jgi:hypothetical protein
VGLSHGGGCICVQRSRRDCNEIDIAGSRSKIAQRDRSGQIQALDQSRRLGIHCFQVFIDDGFDDRRKGTYDRIRPTNGLRMKLC